MTTGSEIAFTLNAFGSDQDWPSGASGRSAGVFFHMNFGALGVETSNA